MAAEAQDTPEENPVQNELLTYGQVSRQLGLPLGTLYALVHEARIPHVRLGKRLVRFRASHLERWVEDRTVIPAGTEGRSR